MQCNPAIGALTQRSVELLLDDPAQATPAEAQPSTDSAAPDADPSRRSGRFVALFGSLSGPQHAGAAAPGAHSAAAGSAARDEQARELVEEGGLESPGPKPPPSQQELDNLAAAINAADDDAAVRIANDPRAMALATPQQKAALVAKLMDGYTNGSEEAAIRTILLSTQSKEELDQVIQMSGGWDEIADELEDGDLSAIGAHAARLTQKQDAAVAIAIDLLFLAQDPEEFERRYRQLGGDQLKHKLPAPPNADLLARLDALGEKFGVAGVGFGLPPEKTIALQAAVQEAIDEEDNDAIVKLSENSDAMKAASPAQKARMIAILQDGWTKDSQDMAIARILTSCGSKAEFDKVVDMAGGPQILDDVDYAEAKADINKMMGGFDRIDCADDKATAVAYQGTMMPPAVDELTRTRAPSDEELGAILGQPPLSDEDRNDPALDAAARKFDAERARMGQAAHDLHADPAARNKLAMTNRERQLNGQPPLDYTSLVTEAYQLTNDPSFSGAVDRVIAETEKNLGKLDNAEKQKIREHMLEQRLGALAEKYGLSEQAMKTLVTAKMGRVLQEGAAAVQAVGVESIQSLRLQLHQVERNEGSRSAEAKRLREVIGKLGGATSQWASQLQASGVMAANCFKVPPSFAEDLVKALSVVADVLATVVNVIPGVGTAISAAYFGIKAIVGLATGDILGAFKSLLSAVPGVSGIFGAASAVINAGAKLAQAGIAAGEGIANGNPLAFAGALGGMAGNLGIDLQKFVPASELVQGAVKHGTAAAGLIDGVVRGDVGAILGATLPGELRAVGASALADGLDALGASPAAQAFKQTSDRVSGLLNALGQNDPAAVGAVLRQWMPQLQSHSASEAIAGLADQAKRLLRAPEFIEARKSAQKEARQAQQILKQLAALEPRIADVRRFEDAAAELQSRLKGDWQAAGADLLRRLGLR